MDKIFVLACMAVALTLATMTIVIPQWQAYNEALHVCQLTQSYDTCFDELNR